MATEFQFVATILVRQVPQGAYLVHSIGGLTLFLPVLLVHKRVQESPPKISTLQHLRASTARNGLRFLWWKTILSLLFTVTVFPAAWPQQQDAPRASNAQNVLQFLDQTIVWYRHIALERQAASTPNDVFFANDNAQISDEIVRLSFEFARAEEGRGNRGSNGQSQTTPSRYQALSQMYLKLDAQARQAEQNLDSLRKQLETATGRKRQDLESSAAELQSEVQLFDTRRDVLHTMMEFVGSTTEGIGATGLAAQIDALSHSVPSALTRPSGSNAASRDNPSSAAVLAAGKPASPGIWGLITDLLSVSQEMHTLDQGTQLTSALAQSSKQLQTPLVNDLKQMAHQGDTIAAQPDPNNLTLLTQNKTELDNLTAQFKLESASFVPLGKQAILLDLYSRNLTSWRSAVKSQYSTDLKNLLLRLLGLAVVLGMVLGVAEIWRRMIFRYVHDTRRRYQMLLLRKIGLWLAIVLVIAFSFATELGSVATFAGLLTAGVAVALQNVILSVAGYFFLIGKYGVRVGDRVQISGVTGEVVEIGLVRLHVMELGGSGRDVQPTGRVVAFSNAFVFQPTVGMFKQIPGTSFVWHEMTLTLASDGNYRGVETRMVEAVDAAFADYQVNLERQRMQMEMNLGSVSVAPLRPRVGFRLTPSGLEVIVSFPAEMQNASEIDDRVTREILREIERDPKLKMVGSDIPTIREVAELPQPKAS
jgi:small-conductance mechanosensitive channel